MIYIKYRVQAKPKSRNFLKYGGAYIGCWIKTRSKKVAQERASNYIAKNDWVIEICQDIRLLGANISNQSKKYVKKAKLEGQAFAIFTWPSTPQRKDKIH